MMNGWDSGMGAGGWVLMGIAWVALIGVIVWSISRLIPGRANTGSEDAQARENAIEILDRRLATGEIDTEEYARRREALTSPAGTREVTP